MDIVHFPHPALRFKSGDVTQIDDRFRAVVREMFDLMYAANGVGLAANQVGIPLRFFVFNPSGEREIREEERVFINPVIRNRKGSVVGEEGCLSLPNLFGDVRRAETIVIEAFNLEGEELRGTLEDLPARVFQHELDHLDGVLFIDRLSPEGYAELQAKLGDMQAAWRLRQAAGEVPPDEEILRRLRVVAGSDGCRPSDAGRIPSSTLTQHSGGWSAAPHTHDGDRTFALPTFEELCASPHPVVGLVTQPDRAGRGHHHHPHPMKAAALERGVPVFQPENVNAPESLERLHALGADLFVVAAYGQILSPELLMIPPLGAINVHASLLPKYRGAAPVQYAILRGETETGVTIFRIEPRLDAGPILGMVRTPIGERETSGDLERRLAALAAPLTREVVEGLAAGRLVSRPQDPTLVSRAPRLKKEQGLIDWSQRAAEIDRHVRGMQPWPMPYTFLHVPGRPPLRMLVLEVAPMDVGGEQDRAAGAAEPGVVLPSAPDELVVQCSDTAVRLLQVQPAGKRAMTAAEFRRGHALPPGCRLGPEAG